MKNSESRLTAHKGLIWGQCPYGTNWACNDDDGGTEAVANWVIYWNTPRDENGCVIAL